MTVQYFLFKITKPLWSVTYIFLDRIYWTLGRQDWDLVAGCGSATEVMTRLDLIYKTIALSIG